MREDIIRHCNTSYSAEERLQIREELKIEQDRRLKARETQLANNKKFGVRKKKPISRD